LEIGDAAGWKPVGNLRYGGLATRPDKPPKATKPRDFLLTAMIFSDSVFVEIHF